MKEHGVGALLRAAGIGALAGLAGSYAMNRFQQFWSEKATGLRRGHGAQSLKVSGPQMHDGKPEDPNTRLARRVSQVAGIQPSDRNLEAIGTVGHYALGSALGAMYGIMTDVEPQISRGYGTLFAAGVWAGIDEIGMSATGLSGPLNAYPAWVHAYGLASHLVYGIATDLARRALTARE